MTEYWNHQIVIWTARLSAALYLFALRERFFRRAAPDSPVAAFSSFWAAAWLALLLHTLCAFHFEHRWDHAAAIAHTAEMTQRAIGWYWAGGLYFNYLFVAAWGIDVAVNCFSRRRTTGLTFHVVSAFMWLNATVVFGSFWWLIPLLCWLIFCLATRSRLT